MGEWKIWVLLFVFCSAATGAIRNSATARSLSTFSALITLCKNYVITSFYYDEPIIIMLAPGSPYPVRYRLTGEPTNFWKHICTATNICRATCLLQYICPIPVGLPISAFTFQDLRMCSTPFEPYICTCYGRCNPNRWWSSTDFTLVSVNLKARGMEGRERFRKS